MIKYIEHKDIDFIKWDNCIKNSLNNIVYAYSWYLNIVTENNWDAYVLDDYEAVMPLPVRNKFGIRYLYQPLFTQQLGVFSTTDNQLNINAFITETIKDFKFAEYNFNVKNTFDSSSANVLKNLNLELDLKRSYKDILSGYSQNHKRNLKKAKENRIVTAFNTDFQAIISLFRQGKGNEIKAFNNKSYLILEKLLTSLSEKNMLCCIGSYNENSDKLIAGIIFLKHNNRQIFLFSGNNKIAKEVGAMYLLADSFIEQSCETTKTLDFEGSNNENLARFYRGFGSKEKYYFSLRHNNLPSVTKRFLYFYKKLKKFIS